MVQKKRVIGKFYLIRNLEELMLLFLIKNEVVIRTNSATTTLLVNDTTLYTFAYRTTYTSIIFIGFILVPNSTSQNSSTVTKKLIVRRYPS